MNKFMTFDIKQARDSNTVSYWKLTIWRIFIEDKLFVSDNGKTCFDTKEEVEEAFRRSFFWRTVQEYIDYSQKFFDQLGNDEWRKEFEHKIIVNLRIEIKQYTDGNQTDTSPR